VSRDGLLVNGNTRLAAIRALGLPGFDVAVLPADATSDDFFEIEMALQLRKLVHQDYTFTNELLLVDSYLSRTQNEQATINAMQWKREGRKKLRLYQGYLALIQDIRSLNPNLKYEFFDKRAEFVKNLHDEYNKLSEHSPLEAEKLKNTRLMGLFLGLNKDEIRETDEFFLENVILPEIEGDELEQVFAPFMNDGEEVDVLDELLDDTSGTTVEIKKMVIEIASKVIDEEGSINDALVDQHYKKLHSKFRSSARQKREDRINQDLRSEPIEYLKDVTTRIQELADRIPILIKDLQFDSAKFEFQAKKTSKSVTALQDALKRAFDD
jgi:ribosome-associated toxin RatA of RatAB toxin-antitoxin module